MRCVWTRISTGIEPRKARAVRWAGPLPAGFAVRLFICSCVALPVAACAVSVPMDGFVTDADTTGSIKKSDALLYKALDQEDWRRAKAAMAVALDPQGNGASVTWDNPKSGAHGSFVAAAAPVAKADAICRDFHAHMVPDPGQERDLNGSACRGADGEWAVRQAAETGKARG